ncbi:cyclic nucleotide-binding domain-containing protein [Polyangium sorediatum]|uniref:Mechanosensitive ion channel family protein n=1 Tax=Polyangium sorediatum TaxID=889274 RepID=A0ABT6NWR7_9BACT|nr:mechanosensitive ion channel family protein [Polyangium sorediatum]MDI1432790.1 mechanosensitive ion channel family protein [Polyangium sorediatum]
MAFLYALWKEALLAHTFWLLTALVMALIASRLDMSSEPRLRPLGFFLSMHVLALLGAAALVVTGSSFVDEIRIPAAVFGGVAFVGAAAVLLFHVILPRLRLRAPRIVEDVMVAIFSVVTAVSITSRAGINLSGLIATSAVITAILGFSLQDVIGNVAGGLALQLDSSIEVGDRIKVNDVSGRVAEIRWRCTVIETGNGETVLVPNNVLMRSQVTVFGRRQGKPAHLRRVIHFNVDFRYQPSDVIDVVRDAVKDAKVPNVAEEPAPSCVLVDLGDSYGRYALRYWLTDLDMDALTDSDVRTRIFFALERAGMHLAIPAASVLVTEEASRAAQKTAKRLSRRKHLIEMVPLFQALSDAERTELAEQLKYAPFTRGEIIAHQGDAEHHCVHLIEDGTALVRVTENGRELPVKKLGPGSFFGEMSLLTGSPRLATVVAETDVECFRLEKGPFQRVIEKRPELARELAGVLAQRAEELRAARQGIDTVNEAGPSVVKAERDIFNRIRNFFELGTP